MLTRFKKGKFVCTKLFVYCNNVQHRNYTQARSVDLTDKNIKELIEEPYHAIFAADEDKVAYLKSRVKTVDYLKDYSFDSPAFPYHDNPLIREQLELSSLWFLKKKQKNSLSNAFNGLIRFYNEPSYNEQSEPKEKDEDGFQEELYPENEYLSTCFYEEALAKALAYQSKANFLSVDVWDFINWNHITKTKGKSNDTKTATERTLAVSGSFQQSKEFSKLEDKKYLYRSTDDKECIRNAINNMFEAVKDHPSVIFIRNFETIFGPNKREMKSLLSSLYEHQKTNPAVVLTSSSYEFSTAEFCIETFDQDKGAFSAESMNSFVIKARSLDRGFEMDIERGLEKSLFDRVQQLFGRERSVSQEIAGGPWVSIGIEEPYSDEAVFSEWNKNLQYDNRRNILRCNHFQLAAAMKTMGLPQPSLDDVSLVTSLEEYLLTNDEPQKVIGWAMSHSVKDLESHDDEKIKPLTLDGIQRGIDLLRLTSDSKNDESSTNPNAKKEKRNTQFNNGSTSANNNNTETPPKDLNLNSKEAMLKSNLTPPGAIKTRFDSVGGHEAIKEQLHDLVSLPIKRSELFKKGLLSKSISGILLSGPPGTGKTLLAKALAGEASCNFLYVKLSSVMNMYVGESEKSAAAVFSLARKYSPCVIFMDEVDSIFGRRTSDDRSGVKRDVLNELMAAWDGITTDDSRIVVIGATNRPYDLDEAVLRRLPRRLLVDIPDFAGRRKILEVLLRDENLSDDVNLDTLAKMTPSYTGSDLKNVCLAAAMSSVKEYLRLEKLAQDEAATTQTTANGDIDVTSDLPKLADPIITMKCFHEAMKESKSSISEDETSIKNLHEWHAQYGVGGTKTSKKFGFHTTPPTTTPEKSSEQSREKSSRK